MEEEKEADGEGKGAGEEEKVEKEPGCDKEEKDGNNEHKEDFEAILCSDFKLVGIFRCILNIPKQKHTYNAEKVFEEVFFVLLLDTFVRLFFCS